MAPRQQRLPQRAPGPTTPTPSGAAKPQSTHARCTAERAYQPGHVPGFEGQLLHCIVQNRSIHTPAPPAPPAHGHSTAQLPAAQHACRPHA